MKKLEANNIEEVEEKSEKILNKLKGSNRIRTRDKAKD